MSLADIALSVIADDHGDVYRSVIGWLDEVSHETQDSLSKAIAYEPPATGDEPMRCSPRRPSMLPFTLMFACLTG
jgi:cell division inhibitor SulA